jgi:hypothetical protein
MGKLMVCALVFAAKRRVPKTARTLKKRLFMDDRLGSSHKGVRESLL